MTAHYLSKRCKDCGNAVSAKSKRCVKCTHAHRRRQKQGSDK